jgi:KDO2-lipid IV(A) lauroyltransferase
MRIPTLKDRLEFAGVSVFVRMSRLLPHRVAVWLGGVLGLIAFDLLRIRRGVTTANIVAHAGQDRSSIDPSSLGRRAYSNFGKTLAEFARCPLVDIHHIRNHIRMDGLAHLDRALREGKGAVLVTGHFGSWELMGCALARMGYPITFVVGVQRNPLVQDLMNRLRAECGIRVVEPASLLEATRVLRGNRFIAMLSDQDAGRQGIFVDFMGSPASTHAGAARLALLAGAPIITGFIIRTDLTRHRIVIEEPIRIEQPADREDAVRRLTEAYTGSIETYVRRYPDHWLWAHRRWKTSPGGGGQTKASRPAKRYAGDDTPEL